MNEIQPTGGQPSWDVIEQVLRDIGQTPSGRMSEWILSHPWRRGGPKDAVVCDMPAWACGIELGLSAHYGGLPVFESCLGTVADAIIQRHNESLSNPQTGLEKTAPPQQKEKPMDNRKVQSLLCVARQARNALDIATEMLCRHRLGGEYLAEVRKLEIQDGLETRLQAAIDAVEREQKTGK